MADLTPTQERAAQQRRVDAWQYPVGTAVSVHRDNGRAKVTTTRSMPYMLGGTAVIKVDGITSPYALERVMPLETEAT